MVKNSANLPTFAMSEEKKNSSLFGNPNPRVVNIQSKQDPVTESKAKIVQSPEKKHAAGFPFKQGY